MRDTLAAGAEPGTIISVEITRHSDEQRDALNLDDAALVFELNVTVGDKAIHDFDGVVTVFIPYTGANADKLTVFYRAEDGTVTEMPNARYDDRRGGFVFTTKHFSVFFLATSTTAKEMPFTDVKTTDWFYDAVKYVYEKGMMNGTSDTTFAPNSNLTRAMLVTSLYRHEGELAITDAAPFTDVASGQWYSDAIAWASANDIVGGYGDGLFGTNDNITREQLATILMRYAKFKRLNTARTTDLAGFDDTADISSWALDAMKWANSEGLVNGRSDTMLAPKGTATRAEVATILMRFTTT